MEIVFLGTSSMVPTKERNVTGLFLGYRDDGILFDCGEGTQRQMNICGINRNRVKKILISHWHGDHVGGIIGLIQTISNGTEDIPRITIYGPKGTKKFVSHLIQVCEYDAKVDLSVEEIDPKGVETFFENEHYKLQCAKLDHKVPCLGYSFVEKDTLNVDQRKMNKIGMKEGPHLRKLKEGKEITYKGNKIKPEDVTYLKKGKKVTVILDTQLCDNCFTLAEGADLLICEASYASKLENKALEYKHMTAKWAAMIANQADVKKLILTHFSQRYKNTLEIAEDASMYFDNVICAEDFMKIRM